MHEEASSCDGAREIVSHYIHSWADLLRRVFAGDVLQCPCGGRRSIVAVIAEPSRVRV